MTTTAPNLIATNPVTGGRASRATRDAGASPAPVTRRKRRHPARKSRIAALALSLAGTGAMSVGMFHADRASAAGTSSSAQSSLKSGTYTGATSSNKFGNVQVRITVASGKITDVSTLQVPSGKSKSVRINNRAVPVLRAEALAAQSASIDNVSEATYTTKSYHVSLQSAIDQARGVAAAA